jgi:hypothetical protein
MLMTCRFPPGETPATSLEGIRTWQAVAQIHC